MPVVPALRILETRGWQAGDQPRLHGKEAAFTSKNQGKFTRKEGTVGKGAATLPSLSSVW